MYEEFHYSNAYKLSLSYSGPYKLVNKQLSEINFEIDQPHFKRNSEIIQFSKLRYCNDSQNFKLHHE